MSWAHDALAEDLARHLRSEKTMVWQDIQLGPSGSPRPDVYTLAKSFANPNPRAYEAKISRPDFLADVTAGKWRTYLTYADSVVFAVPAGLVTPAEIPHLAGLMVRGETGWRTLKRATPCVVSIPQSALLKLLIDGIEREGGRHKTKSYAEYMRGVDRFCEKFGADAARWVANREHAEAAVSHAEYTAERIVCDAKQRAESWLKKSKEEAPREWARLVTALNLPEDADEWAVKRKVSMVCAQAGGWGQPAALTSLRRTLERAMECTDELIDATKPKEAECEPVS